MKISMEISETGSKDNREKPTEPINSWFFEKMHRLAHF